MESVDATTTMDEYGNTLIASAEPFEDEICLTDGEIRLEYEPKEWKQSEVWANLLLSDRKQRLTSFSPQQYESVAGAKVLFKKEYENGLSRVQYGKSQTLSSFVPVERAYCPMMDDCGDYDLFPAPVDENGLESSLFSVPIDFLVLSKGGCGVILDSDLGLYRRGLCWMLNPEEYFPVNHVYRILADEMRALWELNENGLGLGMLDGHALFFEPEYGMFQWVLDPMHLCRFQEEDKDVVRRVQVAQVTNVLLYQLTGAILSSCLDAGEDTDEYQNIISFLETGEVSGSSEKVVNAFNALPAAIHKAFLDCYVNEQYIDELKWEALLRAAAEESVECCVACGHIVSASAQCCAHCGQSTSKQAVNVVFRVRNAGQTGVLQISFGRGRQLFGKQIDQTLEDAPLMQLFYRRSENKLGLRNLSKTNWKYQTDTDSGTVLAGKVCSIEPSLKVYPDATGQIEMEFVRYELCE